MDYYSAIIRQLGDGRDHESDSPTAYPGGSHLHGEAGERSLPSSDHDDHGENDDGADAGLGSASAKGKAKQAGRSSKKAASKRSGSASKADRPKSKKTRANEVQQLQATWAAEHPDAATSTPLPAEPPPGSSPPGEPPGSVASGSMQSAAVA